MSACSRCGAPFSCANVDRPGDPAPCWCAQLPLLPPAALVKTEDGALASCLCPDCLKAALAAAGQLPEAAPES